ncbi:MAG: hypothetical protein PHU08_00170 [Dehalococcoidales bacterium]|nr:hypothetical protein [Dehalococcoidales bacterium]
MNLLTELDETLKLLEAQIPGSLANPQNAKLERGLEKTVAEYFKRVDDAMPDLSEIYYRNAVIE